MGRLAAGRGRAAPRGRSNGIPYGGPEIVLLYKAKHAHREKDQADFGHGPGRPVRGLTPDMARTPESALAMSEGLSLRHGCSGRVRGRVPRPDRIDVSGQL